MNDKNEWVIRGIKISCKHKRSLCAFPKNNNDPKAHYTKYCKILRKLIKEAKKERYFRLIAKYDNKMKTAWNIIKKETGKIHSVEQVPTLLVNDEKFRFQQI
jgi:hypothetical protein